MNTPKRVEPSSVLPATVITVAIVGSWGALWALGILDQLGTKLNALIFGADLVVIGVVWAVFLRRDLSRRR
jgi:predicted membrane-bound spermidine synthase